MVLVTVSILTLVAGCRTGGRFARRTASPPPAATNVPADSAAIIAALPPTLASLASFYDAKYPTLASVAFLAPFLSELGLDAHALTSDLSAATLMASSRWAFARRSCSSCVTVGSFPCGWRTRPGLICRDLPAGCVLVALRRCAGPVARRKRQAHHKRRKKGPAATAGPRWGLSAVSVLGVYPLRSATRRAPKCVRCGRPIADVQCATSQRLVARPVL
jgi:hypothetical protein